MLAKWGENIGNKAPRNIRVRAYEYIYVYIYITREDGTKRTALWIFIEISLGRFDR